MNGNGAGYLALAPQYTSTGELLAAAARRRGMDVAVLPARGGVGALAGRPGGHYHGGPVFGAGVADALGIALLEPPDDWLVTLPHAHVHRRIRTATLGEARRGLDRPAFVKPPSDKSFPAAVYANGRDLPGALPPGTPVLISDPVIWEREFRVFALDGECRAGSQYAVFGHLEASPLDGHQHAGAVRAFVRELLSGRQGAALPSAVVLDVGLISGEWAVVEANMAWFSNCYAADPARALDVVLRAAGPRSHLPARDHPFSRVCQ